MTAQLPLSHPHGAALGLILVSLAPGCGDDAEIECGPGTRLEGNRCVAVFVDASNDASSDATPDSDSGSGSDSASDVDAPPDVPDATADSTGDTVTPPPDLVTIVDWSQARDVSPSPVSLGTVVGDVWGVNGSHVLMGRGPICADSLAVLWSCDYDWLDNQGAVVNSYATSVAHKADSFTTHDGSRLVFNTNLVHRCSGGGLFGPYDEADIVLIDGLDGSAVRTWARHYTIPWTGRVFSNLERSGQIDATPVVPVGCDGGPATVQITFAPLDGADVVPARLDLPNGEALIGGTLGSPLLLRAADGSETTLAPVAYASGALEVTGTHRHFRFRTVLDPSAPFEILSERRSDGARFTHSVANGLSAQALDRWLIHYDGEDLQNRRIWRFVDVEGQLTESVVVGTRMVQFHSQDAVFAYDRTRRVVERIDLMTGEIDEIITGRGDLRRTAHAPLLLWLDNATETLFVLDETSAQPLVDNVVDWGGAIDNYDFSTPRPESPADDVVWIVGESDDGLREELSLLNLAERRLVKVTSNVFRATNSKGCGVPKHPLGLGDANNGAYFVFAEYDASDSDLRHVLLTSTSLASTPVELFVDHVDRCRFPAVSFDGTRAAWHERIDFDARTGATHPGLLQVVTLTPAP